ncbi:LacI family DNA-binding transcriptional regulator [Paenibacillus sp. FSL R5-0407]|uniref:LacI family DNA-binding transcriptional regulator n=1 Tax=Paenibacillus sp. FSL R5-0407 TaxID=2975320 RepID=UPI0030F54B45
MATIYHIAEKLGISPSTVSRALSGRGYCKEETRQRILQAASELDYAPDHSAKMLKTRVSNKILFAVPDICNPFYFDMIRGINSLIEPLGYLLILMDTKNRLDEELRAIQTLREKYADGMIMVSFHFCDENIAAINRVDAPIILTNRYESPSGDDRFRYVFVDTYQGIKEAVRHFIGQGLERIAYIGGPLLEQTGHERYCGYRDALQEAGLKESPGMVQEADFTETGGYLAGKEILSGAVLPQAIVAANDLMAFGVLKACEERGLRVPDDLLLSGMDDLSVCDRISPKLTSVSLQAEEIGRAAAEMLLLRMQDREQEISNVRLLPRLIVRESSLNPIKSAPSI